MPTQDMVREALTVPTITVNGTHPKDLYEQLSEARHAVLSAIKKAEEAGPNARDYHMRGMGIFYQAQAEHKRRITKLQEVERELRALLDYVADHV
jgi:hypothetical protein